MTARFSYLEKEYLADLNKGIDCSIPLIAAPGRVAAWYVSPIRIEPVRSAGWVGSVAEGGSVNFREITFTPHGHGTHTECVGHITPEVYSINNHIRSYHHPALLRSVQAEEITEETARDGMEAGDRVITAAMIPDGPLAPAFVLRTLPNGSFKATMNYSNSNPPYLSAAAMEKIVAGGVEHLLLDLPSVDRESDGGALRAHRLFWGLPERNRRHCSITEMIFVPDAATDGVYLLNLQFAPFENDASPSRPVLYPAISV